MKLLLLSIAYHRPNGEIHPGVGAETALAILCQDGTYRFAAIEAGDPAKDTMDGVKPGLIPKDKFKVITAYVTYKGVTGVCVALKKLSNQEDSFISLAESENIVKGFEVVQIQRGGETIAGILKGEEGSG